MNIKALITTLAILGSSSVAMARPAVTVSASAHASFGFNTGPEIRDHRTPIRTPVRAPVYQAPVYQNTNYTWQPYTNSWERRPRSVLLASDLNFGNTEYRKDIVPGGASAGRFDTLQLRSEGGQTFLVKVIVEFADGGALQVFDLNKTLRGNQSLNLDLSGEGRTIHRILVYRADGGAAEHINQAHYGEFSVLAL